MKIRLLICLLCYLSLCSGRAQDSTEAAFGKAIFMAFQRQSTNALLKLVISSKEGQEEVVSVFPFPQGLHLKNLIPVVHYGIHPATEKAVCSPPGLAIADPAVPA